MGIGASVFLLAVGAILTFAVETESAEGIDINTVGIILMIAGAIGIFLFLAVFGRRDTIVEGRGPVVERRTYE
jgi:hypothetical protein